MKRKDISTNQKLRKKAHSSEFKFKVALEALRGEKTTAEIRQEFGVVSSQIFKWRKKLLESGASVFGVSSTVSSSDQQTVDKLHDTIGRLKVENDF